jgi:hypothetical protein
LKIEVSPTSSKTGVAYEYGIHQPAAPAHDRGHVSISPGNTALQRTPWAALALATLVVNRFITKLGDLVGHLIAVSSANPRYAELPEFSRGSFSHF